MFEPRAARGVDAGSAGKALAVAVAAAAGFTLVDGARVAMVRWAKERRLGRGIGASRAMHAYLLNHLSGSDAAYGVVERLLTAYHDTEYGELFHRLYWQFTEERVVLTALQQALGGSTHSWKRAAGQAAGVTAQAIAGNLRDPFVLFQALESLAIGVQGKRLLWRVLEELSTDTGPAFRDLEAQAVDQWKRIEELRRSIALPVFAPPKK